MPKSKTSRGLGCCGPGKLPEKRKLPKVVRRGCKTSLGPREQEALALVQNGVAPVQKRVWVVQKTLGRPLLAGPEGSQKDLLHPPLTTFGDFPFLGNFPGPQHPNARAGPWTPCFKSPGT